MQLGADGGGGGDLYLAAKAAHPAEKLLADTDGHVKVEMLCVLRAEHRLPAKALPHDRLKVGSTPQGDPVLGAAEHIEVLAQVGRQVEGAEELLAPARLVQHQHPGHPVHPVVAHRGCFFVLIGDQVIAAVFPRQLPRAYGAHGAAALVAELHQTPPVDGSVQRVDAVQKGLAVGLGASVHIHLTLQLGALIVGAEGLQLVDDALAGARRDDAAGLYRIHQQLQLRKLERTAGHPVPAAAPALQLDVVAQTAQGVDVAVNALALGQNALIFQQLHQLGHVQAVVLVGALLKDAQQRYQLGFLSFLLGHGAIPPSRFIPAAFCQRRRGAGWKGGTSVPACPGRLPQGRRASPAGRNRTGRSR